MRAAPAKAGTKKARAAAKPKTGVVTRDPEATRARILEAATEAFAGLGLGGARVDEIARLAGVNKALLYHYFGNKEALYLAVLEETYARIRGAENELALETLAPRAAMEKLVDFTWRYFLDHPEFIDIVNTENLHRARYLAESERLGALHHPLVERIREILERGVADGVFRAGVDPVQLYVTIAGLGYFYLSNAHTLGVVFDRDLLSPRARARRRRHIQEVVAGYLRPESSRA